MTDAYEKHLQARRDYLTKHSQEVRTIKGASVGDIQHILWMKTLSQELEDGAKCRTFRGKDGEFGFTECLVNRLMHLAYLKGSQAIEETSYRKGWDDRL